MSHRSGSSSSRMTDHPLFTLQSMEQQFERLNVVLGNVSNRIDHQTTTLRNLQGGAYRRWHEKAENKYERVGREDEDLVFNIGLGRQRRTRCEGGIAGNPGVRGVVDSNLGGNKTSIPSLQMRTDHKTMFHTRCHVNDKVCNMIIDRKSYINVASTSLVEKLNLPTFKHSQPYTLQWFNDCGKVRVDRQVFVSFSIGRYHDKVLCDVVPMHIGHILLGKPWQYERRVNHDKLSNMYSFVKDGKTIKLAPLTPNPVYAGQLNSKGEVAQKRKNENESVQNKKSENESAQNNNSESEIEQNKSESDIEKKRESEKKNEQERERVSEFEQEEQERKNVEPGEQKENESFLKESNQSIPSLAISLLQKFDASEERESTAKSLHARESEVKRAFFIERPMHLVLCKDSYLHATNQPIPSLVVSLLQECEKSSQQYALVRTLETPRHYLWPKEIVIDTDHKPLQHLQGQGKLPEKHARGMEHREAFSPIIPYKQGKEDIVVNTLSRRYVLLISLSTRFLGIEFVKALYADNIDVSSVYMVSTTAAFGKIDVHNGYALKENKLCVPSCSMHELWEHETHVEDIVGHFGVKQALDILSKHICGRKAKSRGKTHRLYATLTVPSEPWVNISMNIVSRLPSDFVVVNPFSGKDCLPFIECDFVVVNRFCGKDCLPFIEFAYKITIFFWHTDIHLCSRYITARKAKFKEIVWRSGVSHWNVPKREVITSYSPLDLTPVPMHDRSSKKMTALVKSLPKQSHLHDILVYNQDLNNLRTHCTYEFDALMCLMCLMCLIWLCMERVIFLDRKGIGMAEEQVEAIKAWPTPKHARKAFQARKRRKHVSFDPGEYNELATFKKSNHFPFDVGQDSRSNRFEERGNDVIPVGCPRIKNAQPSGLPKEHGNMATRAARGARRHGKVGCPLAKGAAIYLDKITQAQHSKMGFLQVSSQEDNKATWAAILGIQSGLSFWASIYLKSTWKEANTRPNTQDGLEDGETMFLHLIQAIT